VDTIGSSAVLI